MARDSDDFEALLDEYLDPPVEGNPRYQGVRIVWVDDDPALGSRHIEEKHGVFKHEVEEVILEILRRPDARQHILQGRCFGEPRAMTGGCSSCAKTGRREVFAS